MSLFRRTPKPTTDNHDVDLTNLPTFVPRDTWGRVEMHTSIEIVKIDKDRVIVRSATGDLLITRPGDIVNVALGGQMTSKGD